MTFGWSWEYIDDYMTIPRLLEMNSYWEKYPPLHVMVAQYFKLGDQGGANDGATQPDAQAGTMDDLLREFGNMGGTINSEIWN